MDTNSKTSLKKSFSERSGFNLFNKEHLTILMNCFSKYILLIISVLLSISLIFIAITDSHMFESSYFFYLVLITFPLTIAYIFLMPKDSNFSYTYRIILTIILISILFIFIFVIYYYLSPIELTVLKIIRIIIFTLFILFILYNIFYQHANEMRGIFGYILRLLLLIPKTIIEIIKWIYQKSTFANVLSVIFLIMLCLIILFILYYSYIIDYINGVKYTNNNDKSQLLLKGPITINTKSAFSLNNPPTLPNYTFSFWIYVNNFSTNNYEIPIFKYGLGIPYITINNKSINNMNFYPSQYHVNQIKPFPFSIKSQKWNYIVIQYTGDTVEFYLNNELITTMLFYDYDKPNYNSGDNIIIGDDNIASNGVGALSNINYYNLPLTLSQINSQYELLLLQNIPT